MANDTPARLTEAEMQKIEYAQNNIGLFKDGTAYVVDDCEVWVKHTFRPETSNPFECDDEIWTVSGCQDGAVSTGDRYAADFVVEAFNQMPRLLASLRDAYAQIDDYTEGARNDCNLH